MPLPLPVLVSVDVLQANFNPTPAAWLEVRDATLGGRIKLELG